MPRHRLTGPGREVGLPDDGPSLAGPCRRSSDNADRIARGANAGNLPVERSTQYDFGTRPAIATVVGPTSTQSLLPNADRVIR
jgi:hypothetical protein